MPTYEPTTTPTTAHPVTLDALGPAFGPSQYVALRYSSCSENSTLVTFHAKHLIPLVFPRRVRCSGEFDAELASGRSRILGSHQLHRRPGSKTGY